MLHAGNNLEKAREVFTEAIKHRPCIRLTIRQSSGRWKNDGQYRQATGSW